VAQSAVDDGYQAIAKLRLAGELLESKSYDDALKQLDGSVPKEFEPLVADRKGDIYNWLQGKRDEAQAEYTKAWTCGALRLPPLIEIKLTALGVDPKSLAPVETPSHDLRSPKTHPHLNFKPGPPTALRPAARCWSRSSLLVRAVPESRSRRSCRPTRPWWACARPGRCASARSTSRCRGVSGDTITVAGRRHGGRHRRTRRP
jgi:hypothetical protein